MFLVRRVHDRVHPQILPRSMKWVYYWSRLTHRFDRCKLLSVQKTPVKVLYPAISRKKFSNTTRSPVKQLLFQNGSRWNHQCLFDQYEFLLARPRTPTSLLSRLLRRLWDIFVESKMGLHMRRESWSSKHWHLRRRTRRSTYTGIWISYLMKALSLGSAGLSTCLRLQAILTSWWSWTPSVRDW